MVCYYLRRSETLGIPGRPSANLTARTIYPAHTMGDGDTVFALATGTLEGQENVTLIGALAADVMAEAILRAVRLAEGLPGIPSVSDLGR